MCPTIGGSASRSMIFVLLRDYLALAVSQTGYSLPFYSTPRMVVRVGRAVNGAARTCFCAGERAGEARWGGRRWLRGEGARGKKRANYNNGSACRRVLRTDPACALSTYLAGPSRTT